MVKVKCRLYEMEYKQETLDYGIENDKVLLKFQGSESVIFLPLSIDSVSDYELGKKYEITLDIKGDE